MTERMATGQVCEATSVNHKRRQLCQPQPSTDMSEVPHHLAFKGKDWRTSCDMSSRDLSRSWVHASCGHRLATFEDVQ